jgi:hypothetical protein
LGKNLCLDDACRDWETLKSCASCYRPATQVHAWIGLDPRQFQKLPETICADDRDEEMFRKQKHQAARAPPTLPGILPLGSTKDRGLQHGNSEKS